MTFNVAGLRDAEDPSEDDWLFPVLSDRGSTYPVVLHEDDGHGTQYRAKSLLVELETPSQVTKLMALRDHEVDLVVTDTRVIFHCAKFTKGGGWVGFGAGGLAIAAATNAISHARASRRRRGRALVGQVRYSWMVRVGARASIPMLNPAALRIELADPNGRGTLSVELDLQRSVDASRLAQEIAVAAARYRLTHERAPSTETHASLDELARSERFAPSKTTFQNYRFPTFLPPDPAATGYRPTTVRGPQVFDPSDR